ncbi:MAG TPA: GyrI-like domain-containing protein [Acidimicrobiales bacterium]|nr:GyrI-like domain-containing protein [Acidimicrobiales bacterium]
MTTRTAVEFDHPRDYRDEITARSDRIRLLAVPERRYLMVEGEGEPASQGFREAIGALYPVACTLHFALKKRGLVAPVGSLEGLFWTEEPVPMEVAEITEPVAPVAWRWRLVLPVPAAATDADCASAAEEVRVKKNPPLIDRVRCDAWEEGPVAQILHVGPYDAERPTIERLHQAIKEKGLHPRGCHHEIYISDPNRTKPERLKTIIRQAVA